MVAAEVITGLWIGWLARLLVLALPVAGQFIAYMLGVANVLQPDPELGGQATPIARLFAVAAPLAILVTGLYALPLAALAGSYRLIPPGTLLPAADTAETAVRAPWRQLRAGRAPRLAVPAGRPSSGTSRPACSPGWCRGCRSTSSSCPDRSSAASCCSRSLATALLTAWQDSCPVRLRQPAGPVSAPWPAAPAGGPDRSRNTAAAAKGARGRPGSGLARAAPASPGWRRSPWPWSWPAPRRGARPGAAAQRIPGAGARTRRPAAPAFRLAGLAWLARRGAVRAGGDARRRGGGAGADALPAERQGAAGGLLARQPAARA